MSENKYRLLLLLFLLFFPSCKDDCKTEKIVRIEWITGYRSNDRGRNIKNVKRKLTIERFDSLKYDTINVNSCEVNIEALKEKYETIKSLYFSKNPQFDAINQSKVKK